MSRAELTDEQRDFGRAIAAAIRAARTRAGLTVRQVADKSGLSVDTLRTLEAGRVASPGFALICAVTNAVGADLTAFASEVAANVSKRAPASDLAVGPAPRPSSGRGNRAGRSAGSPAPGRVRASTHSR